MKIKPYRANLTIPARQALQDGLFLGLVVLLSCMLYVGQLGFYVDDWAFLKLLYGSNDPSFPGLVKALFSGDIVIRQRPVQVLYLAGLYWLAGPHPLAYHLANVVVLLSSGVLFYLSLRELGQSRLLALTIPLVYILLPHYSTDRFWIAAHQATLCIALYFLSLYADLRALRRNLSHSWRWKALSLLALVGSGLAYEVALPLFLLNPFLVWRQAQRLYGSPQGKQVFQANAALLVGSNILVLLLVTGYKALTTVRLNVESGLAIHLLSLVSGAVRVNYGVYGLGLPYISGWILRNHASWPVLLVGSGLGLLVFVYLFQITRQKGFEWPDKDGWLKMLGLGFAVFGLGYAIFSFNADVWFTSASLGNRIAIAAAVGVAMTFVGGAGLAGSLFSDLRRRQVFCLLAALICASGFLINNTLASFWKTAYRQQQVILSDIRQQVPVLPTESTLILHGVCLEYGGAYIFTGKRDLAGALAIAYRDPSLWATTSELSPKVTEEGLFITVYGSDRFYPYSEDLLLYNHNQKKVYSLVDAASARGYFQSSDFIPERDCPPGFAWGINAR